MKTTHQCSGFHLSSLPPWDANHIALRRCPFRWRFYTLRYGGAGGHGIWYEWFGIRLEIGIKTKGQQMRKTIWLPRADLEAICGIAPIESAFIEHKRVLRYRHNKVIAELPLDPNLGLGELFDKEIECCKKAFKQRKEDNATDISKTKS